MIQKIKDTWVLFRIRTRLDILMKSYIVMIIIFGVMSIILNTIYPIIFSLSLFSLFVIIAGGSVFIDIFNELKNKQI